MALLKYGNHVDANGYEIRNRKIEKVSELPSPKESDAGREVFLTSTNRLYVCTGSSWELKATDSDLLEGKNGAYYRELDNATGSITSARVSDFDTQVRNNQLDQLAPPTGPLSLNGQKITNLAPASSSTDAVTKAQLDAVSEIATSAASGVALKLPVRVAATENIPLSGTQTIDGIALVAGDRVLVAGQNAAASNGIYIASANGWTRATDSDEDHELTPGTLVAVYEGVDNGDTLWGISSDSPIVVGTSDQIWNKVLGAGESGFLSAGNGLVASGSTVSVRPGVGIIADSSSTRIDTNVVARKFVGAVPAGNVNATITHNLNSVDVQVTVREVSSGDIVLVQATATGTNTVSLSFGAAPTTNQYRVIVVG